MLGFFKKKHGSVKKGDEAALDGGAVCRLMQLFPVGTKVCFYPEYRKEITLDSVVIAYAFNDQIVYSTLNLSCDDSTGVIEFDDQGHHYKFKKINSFRIVLPVSNEGETKLDYVRREELRKVGSLVKGNTITMTAPRDDGQVPVVETVVYKRSMLSGSLYAGQTVAFLDVDMESLVLSDKRTQVRLQTNIPATLQVNKEEGDELLNAAMVDFSDSSLRLLVDQEFSEQAMPKAQDSLVISFNLPGQSEYVSLIGDVFRVTGRAVVVMLTGYMEQGQVEELGQIELLKIKANLLQHANTSLSK